MTLMWLFVFLVPVADLRMMGVMSGCRWQTITYMLRLYMQVGCG